jgi:hypothetical protein
VSIVDRDDRPEVPVRPAIEVVAADATGAAPPALRATVVNTADHPIEVGEERAIVFAFVASEEPGLTLVPTDTEAEAVETGCWRLSDAIAIPEYYGVVTLEPGESTARRVGVWGSPEGEGCLPTGAFRFTTEYTGARDRDDDIEDQEWSARWGFTLAVE